MTRRVREMEESKERAEDEASRRSHSLQELMETNRHVLIFGTSSSFFP